MVPSGRSQKDALFVVDVQPSFAMPAVIVDEITALTDATILSQLSNAMMRP
jgi:hypothetical protein